MQATKPTQQACRMWKRINKRKLQTLEELHHLLPTLPQNVASTSRPLLVQELEALERLEDSLGEFGP